MKEKPENLIRTELLISYVLRYGVLLCLGVIGIGLAARLALAPGGNAEVVRALVSGLVPGDYHPPSSAAALFAGAWHFQPDVIIALGLVMLISLPILRVALTTLVFLVERDWIFFGITLVVLCVLLTGVIFGRAL
ncbi:MAG: DUF1634 domain-containing protein [Bdellovibrionota bacterium]